ncbi:putative lipopolysaccharide export system permease protein lptG [Rhodospirillaceae bacterium LM-1]|nr:putative lipopolysaccharide export system permease protein lptG [Rhodospirillaceae bacterium LM-1]
MIRLSPILSLYIGRQFLTAFLATLAVVSGIVLMFDVIELVRRSSGKGSVGFFTLLEMALYKLPQMVQTLLPFAVMIGAMVVFWRLTRTRELVVTRAAGVSVWQFLAPVMILVFSIGILMVVAFNPLASSLFARYERMQDEIQIRSSNPLSFSSGFGLWLRETSGNRQMIIHANQVRQDGRSLILGNISIFHLEDNRFTFRHDAERGRIADQRIDLEKVWEIVPGRPSEARPHITLPTTLTISKIQDNFSSPETMSFWELPGFIRFTEESGFSAQKHRMYFQSLLASPVLLCAMVLVAAVFSLRPNLRMGGVMIRLGGGVAAGFLFFFFSKVAFALGLSATLPPTLAAWSPAMVTLLAGLSTLFHLEDG